MSLTAPIQYAVKELTKLGYTEWEEPFDPENIPSSLMDKAFHVSMDPFNGFVKENVSQAIDVPVTVRCFFKGFRTPKDARDEAIAQCDEIIADMINATNFRSFSIPITGVQFDSGRIDPFENDQNDNVVVAVLTFVFRIYICVH